MPQLKNRYYFLTKPVGAGWVFIGLWLLTALLHLPAQKAGFVADYTGWLDQMQQHGFWDNVNRTYYHGQSLYQFTQFNTWIFFKLMGTNPFFWHYLFVTMHAINAFLLYKLSNTLLHDIEVSKQGFISLAGVILFCVAPHIAEVVVWEPSFHFLQGLMLILLILNLAHEYMVTAHKKYAIIAGVLFFLSSFSLEIFYITPWLLLTMTYFYKHSHPYRKLYLKKTLAYIFAPQLLVFAIHLILFRVVYGGWVAHIGTSAITSAPDIGLGKPAKHLFHIIFLGRFMSDEARRMVYAFCDSRAGIISFYSIVALLTAYILFYFRTFSSKGKVAALLFGWVLITLALLVPLWFEQQFLVVYDRYTYFTNAFLYLLIALLVSYISITFIRVAIIAVYALLNIRFTIQVARYWMKSERIINSLLHTFPASNGKTVILLNLPQTMHGAAMIGAEEPSEFKLMYNSLFQAAKINAPVYDALAYNMLTPEDGANVTVINDSTLNVTLNQWGTWWWYQMKGGHSYENGEFKLKLKNPGRWYQLNLKHPANQYQLLYQVGKEWKTVDMRKRNVVQN